MLRPFASLGTEKEEEEDDDCNYRNSVKHNVLTKPSISTITKITTWSFPKFVDVKTIAFLDLDNCRPAATVS